MPKLESSSDREIRLEGLAIKLFRECAGLDMDDPQQVETPLRFIKALRELTTPEEFKFTVFDAATDNMVVVKDMPFATLCKHHVLPFVGVAHMGYVPDGRIVGLSKIPRLINYYAAGLNTQEELTETIADAFMEKLAPKGVMLVMEAQHTCMSIRGVRASGTTRTSSVRGVFSDHSRTAKMEFLEAIR
jgi:GTP cyclohydrolase IA